MLNGKWSKNAAACHVLAWMLGFASVGATLCAAENTALSQESDDPPPDPQPWFRPPPLPSHADPALGLAAVPDVFGNVDSSGLLLPPEPPVLTLEIQDEYEADNMDFQMNLDLRHLQMPMQANPVATHIPSSTQYVLGNQLPYMVQMGPLSFEYAGARVYMGISQASGMFGGSTLAAFSGWLPAWYFDPVSGAPRGERWNPESLLKADLYASAFPAAPGACSCTIQRLTNPPSTDAQCTCDDSWIYRYYLVDGRGAEHTFIELPAEAGVVSHQGGTYDPLPTQYWSQDDQMLLDVSNPCLPVIHYADGSTEEFHGAIGWPDMPPGNFAHAPEPWTRTTFSDSRYNPALFPTCDTSAPLRKVDRNGNVTLFTFPDAYTRVVQDPQGRSVTLKFAAGPSQQIPALLSTVTIDGPGKVPLTYSVQWTTLTLTAGKGYDPQTKTLVTGSAFPDIQLYEDVTGTVSCGAKPCGIVTPQTVPVVQSITIPDGRSYAFQYGPWGNLTRVAQPDGAVIQYQYGSSGSPAPYAAAALALLSPTQQRAPLGGGPSSLGSTYCTASSGPYWSYALQTLQEYGLVAETRFPQGDGPGQAGYTTTTNYTKVDLGTCTPDLAGAATAGPPCCVQVWRTLTMPDGSQHKKGMCATSAGYYGSAKDGVVPHGWSIGEEVWSSTGALVQASYTGTPSTGQLSYQYEVGPSTDPSQCSTGVGGALPYDQRAANATHVKDGVTTTSTYTFGDVLNPGGGAARNSGNETASCLWLGSATSCAQGTGTKLSETDTTYVQDPGYIARNQLRLVSNVTLSDGTGNIVTRRSTWFDEFALTPSGQPNLDTTYTDVHRGNPTSTGSYLAPATAQGFVGSRMTYFDNGAVATTQNPQDLAANRFTTTVVAHNFGVCASNPTLVTTVRNALGHATTTVTECYSNLTLSSTDPNGQVTCSQYDGLGRTVETAVPGDSLSALPACTSSGAPTSCYIRDTSACQSIGGAVGNRGNGPTTWTEYFPFGVNGVSYGSARTVTHVKDGSASGKYTKKFVDGLDRVIASCTKIDPTTSAGASGSDEVCTYSTFDAMGRPFQSYSPSYALDVTAVGAPSGTQYTQTCYDALDRVTQKAALWGGAWTCGSAPPATSFATTTAYTSAGGLWITTETNANGNQSQSATDALGHLVETDEYVCAGSPCSVATGSKLATTMQYDVAGRLLSATDPRGDVMSFHYDGLGRKISMSDPDMGQWTYGYDGNGNLTSQTDAKLQNIALYYDALNRLTIKDLPPAGPGVEDVVNTYDGNVPTCGCPSAWSAASASVCCDYHYGVMGTCDATATCIPPPVICTAGSTQSCDNTACDGSCGKGCLGATQTCNGSGTAWSACTGGTCPVCTPGATQGCDNTVCDEACGSGNCVGGTQTCSSVGLWSSCAGATCPAHDAGSPVQPPPTCTPGVRRACEDTVCDSTCPAGCNGGSQACNATGTGWSVCSGGTCSPNL